MDKPLVKITHKNCYAFAERVKAHNNLHGSVSDLSKHIYNSGKAGFILNNHQKSPPTVSQMVTWRDTKQGYDFWCDITLNKIIPKFEG